MGRIFFVSVVVLGLLSSISFGYSGGAGTSTNPYQIATKADLLALAATMADYSKCFILTADIDLGGQLFTSAIIAKDTSSSSGFQGTTFTGRFDGDGHKIINFFIHGSSNDYLGLFGNVGAAGQIKDLGVEDYSISASIGALYIGGLAGYNNGGNISGCYSAGTFDGFSSSYVGGLLGYNASIAVSDCYSTETITGSATYVGGLIGYLSAGSISRCYSVGKVVGSSPVGGLIGYKSGGSVSNCFWDTETSKQTTSADGIGKTTAQMQTLSTFTGAGWDFTTVWAICEGTNYPRFIWEIPEIDWVCPDGVNVEDLDYFVQRWLLNCIAENNYCSGADMDDSEVVDMADLAMFAQHWLEGV